MGQLILVAAGGLAREALATIERSTEWEVVGFLDDAPSLVGATIAARPVLGGLDAVTRHPDVSLLVCAGRGQARRAIVSRLGGLGVADDRFATVIAPDVHVPTSCAVGRGSILLSGTVLTADVSLGTHVVAMPGVVLTHDNTVADYATLCAGVTLGGNVVVGEAAYLGMGALVRERVSIGAGATLGMGAVLLEDLPAGETWIGVPARALETDPTARPR